MKTALSSNTQINSSLFDINYHDIFLGLQVDGSPPAEDFPPSHYDVSLFKDVDYYGKKSGVKGLQDKQTNKQTKSGKKRKISEASPQKTSISRWATLTSFLHYLDLEQLSKLAAYCYRRNTDIYLAVDAVSDQMLSLILP